MAHDYDRSKTAAVDKVQIFPKFEVKVTAKQIEKIVDDSYDVIPGTCKILRGVSQSHNGAYINFECKSQTGKTLTGSVVSYLENHGKAVRAVAFVNVDG